MAHDVFISYSIKDKVKADAVGAALESHGIRCWIAPRDILPGADWGEAIIHAISNCHVMVLIFSSNSNNSVQVKREVERAVHKGIVVIPLRIEDVVPQGALEYFLSMQHWVDALTPPLENHLQLLAEQIKILLKSLSQWNEQEHVDTLEIPRLKTVTQYQATDNKAQVHNVAIHSVENTFLNLTIPIHVHSLKEVENLAPKSKILLFTFKSEPGWCESNSIKEFESNTFPVIIPVTREQGIIICYARVGHLLDNAFGKDLLRLGVGP